MGKPNCPSWEMLHAFQAGSLALKDSEDIATHVQSCSTCQKRLEVLGSSGEAQVAILRQMKTMSPDEPPLTEVLIQAAVPTVTDAPPGYKLLSEIGKGGIGVVYRAWDLRLDREVAVKLIQERYAGETSAIERFRTEAHITGQLQHPSIPPVHELGLLSDGRPFLVMKLVKGQDLHHLLKERQSPDQDRGQFIAIFEQVCHAVGYAHAHNVIHRDLKPSNIMVGAHGEVQVMDWGLAKSLHDTPSPEGPTGKNSERSPAALEGEIPTPRPSDSETRTGSVLGTPAYMSPEQAAGEIRRVDPRSDVFGLGAILCEILTGRPPYFGKNANEVWGRAFRGELNHAFELLDGCGAEPDLVALCKRCLSYRQEERPENGNVVAQEVARIRQGAEERARQAELERERALVREAEGRKRRRQLFWAAASIAAVLIVGIIGTSLGMWRASMSARAEHQARLEAQRERDAKAQALEAETRARAAEKLARDHAMAALRTMTDELVENQLAGTAFLTPDTKAFLHKVIQHFEGFAKITADDVESRSIRAEGYARVGILRQRLGDLEQAEAAYRNALEIYEALAAEFPTQPDFRHDLAKILNNLGILFQDTARPVEAEAAYRKALDIYEQLVAELPTRPDFREDLARARTNLGLLFRSTGRLAEAEMAWQHASQIYKELAAEFPTRPDCRLNLATIHNNQGVLFQDTGRPMAAEQAFRDALEIYTELALQFPTRPDLRANLADGHKNLGIALRDTGRLTEAEAAFRNALDIHKALMAEFPARPDFRQDYAETFNDVAGLLVATGRLTEAEAAFQNALQIYKGLAVDFPTQPAFRQGLANGHNNLGVLYRDTGRLAEAQAAWEDALKTYKELVADFPTHPPFRRGLAKMYQSLGILFSTTGRPAEAETVWRNSLEIQKQLTFEFPTNLDYRNDVAGTLINLALLSNQRQDFAAAKGYLEEAHPHLQAALEANPQYPTCREGYRRYLFTLVLANAGLLDQEGAVQTARTLSDLTWGQPDNTYIAARAVATCLIIVGEHDELEAAQKLEAIQFYGNEAMKLLSDAMAKGFKDAARLKDDPAFAPLRGREDFQKLLDELETHLKRD